LRLIGLIIALLMTIESGGVQATESRIGIIVIDGRLVIDIQTAAPIDLLLDRTLRLLR
jgi:hypothetical protein